MAAGAGAHGHIVSTNDLAGPSLPLKSLGNIYLFGCSNFDEFKGVDLLEFVKEHGVTLNFPQKVRVDSTQG
jgi:hypothetical protein